MGIWIMDPVRGVGASWATNSFPVHNSVDKADICASMSHKNGFGWLRGGCEDF